MDNTLYFAMLRCAMLCSVRCANESTTRPCRDKLDTARVQLHNRGFVLVAPLTTTKGTFLEEPGSFWGCLQKLPAVRGSGTARDLSRCHARSIRKDLDAWWPVTKPRRARKVLMRLGNGIAMHVQVQLLAAAWARTCNIRVVASSNELSSSNCILIVL